MMELKNITKRDGEVVPFNRQKIENAIRKAAIDAGYDEYDESKRICGQITSAVVNEMIVCDIREVEKIQDLVETKLMDMNYNKIAKAYILYRNKRSEVRRKPWQLSELQESILTNKYLQSGEKFDQWIKRISNGDNKLEKLIRDKKFIFAGRILANRGLQHKGIKVTYSNCYVVEQPSDSIEGIYEAAYKLARTFSLGGGVGVDISNLRPKNSTVHNAAKSTSGAVSFMELFNMTTDIIGQNGRRGALMISMSVDHPDIEDFIDIKTDLTKINKANISVRVTDKFMQAVVDDSLYVCEFVVEGYDEVIRKELNAREVFMKLVKNNWNFAEPGILYWDRISNWNLMSADSSFHFAGTNPCAEEPLPAGGSCLLGSINLSEFVNFPFTSNAEIDEYKLKEAIEIATIGLNDVLDEGLELHPLEEQRKTVSELRQIGLGTMGLADALIKLGIVYGSPAAIEFSNRISNLIVNKAAQTSAKIAKERGSFTRYNYDLVSESEFFKKVFTDETKNMIREFGLRNSQITTQAPNGSISTMFGVSGGIEPIYDLSYIRKTESLHDEDVYYKVYTPIVKEFMETAQITDESLLPESFVTALTLQSLERIKMQSAWQNNIDASISSTINLHNEATIDEVHDIYLAAWEYGLKGVTIFRDGCERSAVLMSPDSVDKDKIIGSNLEMASEKTTTVCPECGGSYTHTGGCGVCLSCGYSKCN